MHNIERLSYRQSLDFTFYVPLNCHTVDGLYRTRLICKWNSPKIFDDAVVIVVDVCFGSKPILYNSSVNAHLQHRAYIDVRNAFSSRVYLIMYVWNFKYVLELSFSIRNKFLAYPVYDYLQTMQNFVSTVYCMFMFIVYVFWLLYRTTLHLLILNGTTKSSPPVLPLPVTWNKTNESMNAKMVYVWINACVFLQNISNIEYQIHIRYAIWMHLHAELQTFDTYEK